MERKAKQMLLTSAFASALLFMPTHGKAAEWKLGMSHPQIKEVQTLLKAKGFFTYPTATGYFGTITETAVKKFQASVQLPVTGIVDDTTYTRLWQAPKPFDPIALVANAAPLLGKPYVWGGQTPEQGFDCSGLIVYLFQQQGITIPRTVATMWNAGTSVDVPAVGDVVFFQTEGTTVSHAGIYIGNNQFLHSASSTGVTISPFNSPYWSARYIGAKRYW